MTRQTGRPARLGILRVAVNTDDGMFSAQVEEATRAAEAVLASAQLPLEVLRVDLGGAAVTPRESAQHPLDLLQLAMTERTERDLAFVLLVTDMRLAVQRRDAVVLPSPLTNVALVSTAPLRAAEGMPSGLLAGALLHALGHLLNLPPHPDAGNVMYRYDHLQALASMRELTPAQRDRARRDVPREARDEIAPGGLTFRTRQLVTHLPVIVRLAWHANPLRLLLNLPGMTAAAAAFSVNFFFLFEFWDYATAVAMVQVLLFGALALFASVAALYGGLKLRASTARPDLASESVTVTKAVTVLALTLTMLLFYAVFAVLGYLGAITIFPLELMTTWPTTDPATKVLDHVKIGLYTAGVAVLIAPLGGLAGRRSEIRKILFLHTTGR